MIKKKKNGKGKRLFTKKELEGIKAALIKEKLGIIEKLIKLKGENLHKTFKEASGDLSGYSFHMADMATDLYDREFSLELAEGERERLFALDDAIKRVADNTYGKCDSCGIRISKQRIKAMPQAELCIKCQEKEEKNAGK